MLKKKLLLDGQYIHNKTPWLNWTELLYGFEHGFIDEKGVSEYACEALTTESSQEAIELASLLLEEKYLVSILLESLVNKEPSPKTEEPAKPWIFLLLSFLFEHQDEYEDPLGIVGELYADFDYPVEISSIIRYMPPPEGLEGSEGQLFENWKEVILTYKVFFEQQNRFT